MGDCLHEPASILVQPIANRLTIVPEFLIVGLQLLDLIVHYAQGVIHRTSR